MTGCGKVHGTIRAVRLTEAVDEVGHNKTSLWKRLTLVLNEGLKMVLTEITP